MAESPASRTPYEVLGVSASASQDDLRRAYRRMLRETHPDTGGTAARFHEVQLAWERVGSPGHREAYDRAQSTVWLASPAPAGATASAPGGTGAPAGPWAAGATTGSARFGAGAGSGGGTGRDTAGRGGSPGAVRARSYGYPGGLARERFVVLMREWLGRGVAVDDVFDPALVQTAPREIRRQLAKAIAEEATWAIVVALGVGYTVWNDIDPGSRGSGKVDHLVLGPAGLFAVQSEDWGGPVRILRGELSGESIEPQSQPLQAIEHRVRALARSLRVKFTATIVVVPDDDLEEAVVRADRGRRSELVLVRRSLLARTLRDGIGGGERASVDRIFELRTDLQERIRFA